MLKSAQDSSISLLFILVLHRVLNYVSQMRWILDSYQINQDTKMFFSEPFKAFCLMDLWFCKNKIKKAKLNQALTLFT